MRKLLILTIIIANFTVQGQSIIHPANNDVFLQNEVAEVHISLSVNNLNVLLGDSLYTDYHFPENDSRCIDYLLKAHLGY